MIRPSPSRATGRPRPGPVAAGLALVGLLLATTAACGGTPPVPPDQAPSSAAPPGGDARDQMAARVAAARDRRYVARYTLTAYGRDARTVTVTVADDGSWLVAIPGGALGGQADIAIATTGAGLFECVLDPPVRCMRVGTAGSGLPSRADPRIQHVFTDWPEVLLDRQAAIAVAGASRLPGARGDCWSVEGNAVALAAPMDAGIFCYDPDGTLTAVKLTVGSLALAGAPAPGPATVTLPGPVVSGGAVPLTAPPSPPPASGSTRPPPSPSGSPRPHG